jgi:hypothetical protein
MTDAELSDLARRALAATSGEAQARVLHERRVGRNPPALEERIVVEIASVSDGRVGVATATEAGDDALSQLAAAAGQARAGDARGSYPGLPAPAAGRPHDGWDPAGRAPRGRRAAAHRRGGASLADGARLLERHRRARAAHSRDRDGRERGGRNGRARGGDGGVAGPRVATADRGAAPIAAGEYRTVLSPAAVAALLGALGDITLNGLAVAEGRSPLAGRLGTRVAASATNLSESPRFTGTLPRSYDAEGVPVAPMPLIQDGVAHRVVHDTRSAALAGGGAASTGHAGRPGGTPGGPRPRNLVLVGGGADGEAELFAPVDAGVHVTALRDVHVVDASAGVIGALAEGRLLRGGEPAESFAPARFTGSPLDVLAAVEALTMRQRLFAPGTVCPALRAGVLRLSPA